MIHHLVRGRFAVAALGHCSCPLVFKDHRCAHASIRQYYHRHRVNLMRLLTGCRQLTRQSVDFGTSYHRRSSLFSSLLPSPPRKASKHHNGQLYVSWTKRILESEELRFEGRCSLKKTKGDGEERMQSGRNFASSLSIFYGMDQPV